MLFDPLEEQFDLSSGFVKKRNSESRSDFIFKKERWFFSNVCLFIPKVRMEACLKRTLDIVCSLLFLIVFSPLFLIIAILIKIDSK